MVEPGVVTLTDREGGNLVGCIARAEQDHGLRDLAFLERYVSQMLVEDLPRPCGKTKITLSSS